MTQEQLLKLIEERIQEFENDLKYLIIYLKKDLDSIVVANS